MAESEQDRELVELAQLITEDILPALRDAYDAAAQAVAEFERGDIRRRVREATASHLTAAGYTGEQWNEWASALSYVVDQSRKVITELKTLTLRDVLERRYPPEPAQDAPAPE